MDSPPPPPPDDIVFSSTPGYRGHTQIILNGCLIAFSVVFVSLRLYARFFMVKRPGIDDILAVLALGTLCALSAMEMRLVEFGSGTHIIYVPQARLMKFFNALTTQSFLYFWAVCLMRLHIAAFLPNLHSAKMYLITVYTIAGITLGSTVIFFIIKLTSCDPISALWLPPFMTVEQCMSEAAVDAMMNAHSVLGILIDLALVALPVWVIYNNMIFSTRKFRVLLIFTVGIFAVATGIVRFVLIRTTPFYIDATYSMTTIGIWTDLEGHIGLWCGCFPALQPIVRAFLSAIGASRYLSTFKNSEYNNYGSGKRQAPGSKPWSRSNALPIPSKPHSLKNQKSQDDNSSETGIVEHDSEGFEMASPRSAKGIVKNTTVDISYEARGPKESRQDAAKWADEQ